MMLPSRLVQGGHYRTIEAKNQEKCLGLIADNNASVENRYFPSSATIRSRCAVSSVDSTRNILLALLSASVRSI